jgi:hypothetical protein
MKKDIVALAAVAAFCCGISPALAADKPAAADNKKLVDVLVLEQASSQTGPMTMTVAKDAVKFTFKKLGITWLSRGPKWQSYTFNPEAKSILMREHSTWRDGLFEMGGSKKHLKQAVQLQLRDRGVKEKIAGYECRKAELYQAPSSPPRLREPKKPYVCGYVWIADNFPAPKELLEVMRNLVKVNVTKGMVLKFQTLKAGSYSSFQDAFETKTIVKAKQAASFFEPPAGYHPVKSEIQLLMEDSSMDDDYLKQPKR